MELILLILLAMIIVVFFLVLKFKGGSGEDVVNPYLLADENFERNLAGECVDERAEAWTGPTGKWLGHALFSCPREAQVFMNPTMPTGGTLALYYKMCFQLMKWEYQVQRADEWVEVSPGYTNIYQLTHKQKDELEARIKAGLASAAQAVADLELLKHDERKYREFLNYIGLKFENGKFIEVGKSDEHSLKAVFIDQVDVHTGDGISMRSIVSRWPTLIVDFLKITDEDMDPEKLKNKLDVSKAEAVVLITKNKLYQQWKKLFIPEIKARYERIDILVKSREKSVDEYREWLKPVVARHKMIEDALLRPDMRKSIRTSFLMTGSQPFSMSNIVIWAWRYAPIHELQKGGTERLAIEYAEKKVDPCDKWTLKNLIFEPDHGLVVKYPWITHDWVMEKKKWIMAQKGGKNPWIIPHKLYYAFLIIMFKKGDIRTASGQEFEDTVFDVNLIYMTQNVLFVKLLELLAKQDEFNRYIDNLIGVGPGEVKPEEAEKEKVGISGKLGNATEKITNFFSMPMTFLKRGPYERDFDERITKIMFLGASKYRYSPVVEFLKKNMGMGVT